MTTVLRLLVLLTLASASLTAQVCRLSVAGLNRNRRVLGPVAAECPNQPLHSAPFGNWGVTSNYGPKLNGHQFDGWCHNSLTCDSTGACRTSCRDGWYEWNSCTTHPLYAPPNCTLYNDANCTQQKSTQDVNVLGTQTVDVRVACPVDVDNDGVADTGGCAGVGTYTHTTNFMSLYELDPVTGDSLIQTLYFPPTPVPTRCSPLGCLPSGSSWVEPNAYDSPKERAIVFAELATVINSAAFFDSAGVCRGVTLSVEVTSAASYAGAIVAPSSLASLFGHNLIATPGDIVHLTLIDARGATHTATPLFTSPAQINFVVPPAIATGQATVALTVNGQTRATGVVRVNPVAPALFSAAATGTGVAAALWQRPNQPAQLTFSCFPTSPPSCAPIPIDVGRGDTYLILFGTGFRAARTLSATIGGVAVTITYAGAQPEFPGLDQLNLLLPPSLAGRGSTSIVLTADNQPANPVTVSIR